MHVPVHDRMPTPSACRHALDQGSHAGLSRRPRIHPVREHFFKEISQRESNIGVQHDAVLGSRQERARFSEIEGVF